MSGTVRLQANAKSNQHMKGLINPRTLQEFEQSVLNEMKSCNYSQLLHQSAVDTSTIRGIKLPNNKMPEQCTVVQLRDMILARGGTVTMNKPELVAKVKQYIFLEKQVEKITSTVTQIPTVGFIPQSKRAAHGLWELF